MHPKYVLSLDGGGSHLLIQLSILACLEEDTGTSSYDLFDLFAGSSSGGMLSCMILGRRMSAMDLIELAVRGDLLQHMMTEHKFLRMFHRLQIYPKYLGSTKSKVLQRELAGLRLSSLEKKILIPCFNLGTDQLEVFTNDHQSDFLLSEIADACTAAPSFYPPVKMEDGNWRIDGGVGMNNPGLSSYIHAQHHWECNEIKVLAIGSGWRSFSLQGTSACAYGGLQWSAKGIASIILREKMMANVKMTEAILGSRFLYINHCLKDFGLPDQMDSASNLAMQRKALEIGVQWYAQQRKQIRQWMRSKI